MSEKDIINIAALSISIIIFIAIQVIMLSFEITNLENKINDLMFKLESNTRKEDKQ